MFPTAYVKGPLHRTSPGTSYETSLAAHSTLNHLIVITRRPSWFSEELAA